ncbi:MULTISPECIES: ankyrin repeat domain-containing protein [unclassified Wolbachia]|uniref:Jg18342 protein n=3 Tax=cellular organisms TaxID=131567 RepID=A0A8S4RIU1_9NEOP|nr:MULTISPECIES: ankyrin repeat domain-containing protein [unclassified Wolbachia]CAH2235640.1 jg18342 [Pararge aegeria aegeria]
MPETYPAWGSKCSRHGIDYQELWLILFLMRVMDKKCPFLLDTEFKSAAGFDDVVLQCKQNKTTIHRFVQVKHNQDGTEKISVGSLLTKSGEFNLLKYFIAYLKIKNNAKFSGGTKHFLFATNMDLDSPYSIQHEVRNLRAMLSGENKGKELSFVRIDTKDEFLDIGDSAKYRISDSDGSIAQYLKQNMDFIKRKIGKEVSNKEIEDFLNELVFVVNLPHEAQLRELLLGELSSKLNKKFGYTGDNQIFCNDLLKKISDWVKDIKARPFSHKEGEELFREVELWASTLGKIEQGVERIERKVDEIGEVLNNQQARKEPIWFNMRYPVKTFTGRSSELKALHNALQRSTGRQAVISQVATISGLGGVGKSELARKYAYKYGKYYGGNVIWINAENFEDMKNSFLRLAGDDRLGIPPKDKHGRDKTIEAIVEEIYAFFARRGRKSLFIFDNAEGYKGIKRFLPSSLHPRHKKPYVLITSRDCKWNVRGEGDIKVIQLDEFGEVEALEFVRKALNIENNLQDREIEELTRELQYFPLALGQAVVYIQDRNEESRLRGDKRFKISDYLKEYQQNAGELLKKGVYENEDRYTKTVLTTWNVTMTYICKEYGFEALSILEIMAYLAPDNICIKEIFSKLITDDKAKLWNAVELLNRYSMIKLREGVVNIHRLVQKVTRLELQEKGREEEVLRKALELINSQLKREEEALRGGLDLTNTGSITQYSVIHIASTWKYASKYSRLIDNFYFNHIWVYQRYPNFELIFPIKDTNLHLLVESNDYEIIETILTHIEDKHPDKLYEIINAKNGYGFSPLHLAAIREEMDMVKCLISKGANVDAKDGHDRTPLYWAIESGGFDMVKLLIDKGADIDAKDEDGNTPLYVAVIRELDIVKHLIDKGADVNTKNKYGVTALHVAAYDGKLNVVKCLVNKCANVNANAVELFRSGTPLHCAVHSGKLSIVKCLIDKGAYVDAKDGHDRTPLHYSALFGSYDIAAYLIREGAYVDAMDKGGNTPLHCATVKEKVAVVRYFVEQGADVNAKNNEGKTALDYVTDNQELVELLLTHDESVEVA